jgi:peptidoglycan/LPS O-acetylase OafA/YrhL
MAARYTWMFRTAAVLFLFFGGVWLWKFGLTDNQPGQRFFGLAAGVLSVLVGVFLLRRHRLAIGVSAAATAVVGISAAVFAPSSRGPAILFLAGLAIVCGLYSVFAVRALREPFEPDR